LYAVFCRQSRVTGVNFVPCALLPAVIGT
jgi:hypothetical protein